MAGSSTDIKQVMDTREHLAAYISSLWDAWKSARADEEERWREIHEFLFSSDTRTTSNSSNPWDNTTVIPKLTQIRDNLEANYYPALFPNRDWLRWMPDNEESASVAVRTKLEAYFKTKFALTGFEQEVKKTLLEWFGKGNGFMGLEWVTRTKEDPMTGATTISYQGVEAYNISPYDISFNPIAKDFNSTPVIVRRMYSMGEIKRLSLETSEKWPKEVLDKCRELRYTAAKASITDMNKNAQLRVDGFSDYGMYLQSGYLEVLEFYGDIYITDNDDFRPNRVVRIIDRMWVMTDEENPSYSGRPYIYTSGWRQRPDNLWAQGALELILGMQYRINHLENAKADAFDQQLDPDLVISGNFDIIDEGPRRLYISDDGQGSVTRLAPDTQILQANMEVQYLMALMEEMAGAPRDAMGIRTPGEKTAFEVSSLYERAGKVFQNKIQQFEQQLLLPLIEGALELTRRNLQGVDTVPVQEEDSGLLEFLRMTPEDLKSKGRLIPVGAQHFAEQARITQNLVQLQQTILNDPTVAVHISGRRMAQVMIEDVLGYQKYRLYEPFVRIAEEAEAQQRMNIAANELMAQEEMEAQGVGYPEDELGG